MEDYQRAVERLDCFAQLSGHDVVVRSRAADGPRRPGGADRRRRGARSHSRANADRRPAARPAPRPAVDLPDGPRHAPHRRRGVHAAGNRRLHGVGIALRACGAHPGADPRLRPAPRRRGRRASGRCLADDDRVGAARPRRSASSATERSARSSPVTEARSGCTWSPGAARASLERARADGHEAEPDLDALFARCDVVSLHLKLVARDARHRDGARISR